MMLHQDVSRRGFVGGIATTLSGILLPHAVVYWDIDKVDWPTLHSSDRPNLLVRKGQEVKLTINDQRSRYGNVRFLRPRNGAALKTIVGAPGTKPARLHDERMFEVLTQPGKLVLLPPPEDTAFGMGSFEIRALAQALPDRGSLPGKVPVTIARLKERRVVPKPGFDLDELRKLGYIIKTSPIPVPDVIRDWRVVGQTLEFGDIEVQEGGTLVIGETVTIMNLQNLKLHTNARVIQKSPRLVVNASGQVIGVNP